MKTIEFQPFMNGIRRTATPKVKVNGYTRVAYGTSATGNVYMLGDTVENALKANMIVRDYERELVKLNPQLKIDFRIEFLD